MLERAGVLAALWCPTDGYLQPNSLTTAYARARPGRMGANVVTGDPGARTWWSATGAVSGWRPTTGPFRTETVINAAGPWAWQVAQMVGLDLPIVPVRHEYFISEPMAGWHADLPVLRLPDSRLYVRAELSSVLCGGWEARGAQPRSSRADRAASTCGRAPDWDVLVLVRRRPRAVRARGDHGGHPGDLPGLAHVHPGRPLRGRARSPAARVRDGGGVQRARCVRLGRAGPARRREPGAGLRRRTCAR